MQHMKYSKDGLELTKQFEQCRLMPYRDTGGVLTNGWGNTHHVQEGVAITQQQADDDLLRNVQDAVDAVNDYVMAPMTQGQFDAFVDFTFNCGVRAFQASTMLRRFNAGDIDGARDELDRWVYDNGKRLAGLQRRRDAEQERFES